jgi:5-methylcytosine-specific restriction endonuclease McrA
MVTPSDYTRPLYKNEKFLERAYVDEEMSTTEIAEFCDCSQRTVHRWVDKLLGTRSVSEAVAIHNKNRETEGKYTSESWLREQYHEKCLTLSDISKKCSVGEKALAYWMGKFGIETREGVTREVLENKADSDIADEEWLSQRYHDDSMSTTEIADELSISRTTVMEWMEYYDIPRRGHDECHPSGKDHPSWGGGYESYYGPNWKYQRERSIQEYNEKCASCGVRRSNLNRDLSVHHVTPLREFKTGDGINYEAANSTDNLVPLCEPCHAKWEGIPVRPQP